MKATVLLCDSAQVKDGKLYILGGGWSVTGPAPQPHAVAIRIVLPWTEANRKHQWEIRLVDADGRQVIVGDEGGTSEVVISAQFEAGRPPGVPVGSELDNNQAFNIAALPLEPGKSYEWRLSIDGECRDEWRAPFTIRSAPPEGSVIQSA